MGIETPVPIYLLSDYNILLLIEKSFHNTMEKYLSPSGLYIRPDFVLEQDEFTFVGAIKSIHNAKRKDRLVTSAVIKEILDSPVRTDVVHMAYSSPRMLGEQLGQIIIRTESWKAHQDQTKDYICQVIASQVWSPSF